MCKESTALKKKKKGRDAGGCIHVYIYKVIGSAFHFTCLACGHKHVIKNDV